MSREGCLNIFRLSRPLLVVDTKCFEIRRIMKMLYHGVVSHCAMFWIQVKSMASREQKGKFSIFLTKCEHHFGRSSGVSSGTTESHFSGAMPANEVSYSSVTRFDLRSIAKAPEVTQGLFLSRIVWHFFLLECTIEGMDDYFVHYYYAIKNDSLY